MDVFEKKKKKDFLFSFLGVSAVVLGVFTAFPLEPCLEESSLPSSGLHWLLSFPVHLTVL